MAATAPIQNHTTFSSSQQLYFLLGFGLVNTIAFLLLIPSFVFLVGGSIGGWEFPAAVFLSGTTTYYAARYFSGAVRKPLFLRTIILQTGVIICALFIADFFYDTSIDGLVYHQESVYQLANGWNPFTKILPDTVSQSVWVNHYPKGAEVPQASIYALTKTIESGKATNIILMVASFCICMSVLPAIVKLGKWKRVLLSLLAVCNPVTINQLFTFYVDGQIACLLLMLLGIIVLLNKEVNRYYLMLLSSLIVITINIKFTSLVFIVVIIAAFLIYLFFRKQFRFFRAVLITGTIAGLVGACFTGYNPYVRNTVMHHHPFYPLMGKSSVDIIKESYPIGFAGKGRFEKFYISFFSHTDNEGSWVWEERAPTLKAPLTMNTIDIENARTEDTRVAGFGPLFSGICLLALMLFIYSLVKKRGAFTVRDACYVLAVLLLTVFLIPEAWWARYVPQLWFVPLILLLFTEKSGPLWSRVLKNVVYLLIALNICFALLSIPYRVLTTLQLKYQLAQLKASDETIEVNWGNARSNRIRFDQQHIPYKETISIAAEKGTEITGSDSKFISPAKMPDIPMPYLLKWWRKFKPLEEKR